MKKCLLLIFTLLLLAFPVCADEIILDSDYLVNPLYEHLNIEYSRLYDVKVDGVNYKECNGFDGAFEYLSEQAIRRIPRICLSYESTINKNLPEKTLKALVLEEVVALFDCLGDYSEYDKNGAFSDYIYFQWYSRNIRPLILTSPSEDNVKVCVSYDISWFTTPAQMIQENKKVEEILNDLDVYDKDEYTQVKTVYDYILDNVKYVTDEKYEAAEASGTNPLYHSSYSALVMGETVCQGYATALYRLLRELGISCRVVSGSANGPHAWNMVRIGSYYYLVDATWDDSPKKDYKFFLKSAYKDHFADPEFKEISFLRFFPMAEEDYTEPLEYIPNPPKNISLQKDGNNLTISFDLDYTAQCALIEKADDKNVYTEIHFMENSLDDVTRHTFTDLNIKEGVNSYKISALRAEINSRTEVQTQHINTIDRTYNNILSLSFDANTDNTNPTLKFKLHLSDLSQTGRIFVIGTRAGVIENPSSYAPREDIEVTYENFDETCSLKVLCVESLSNMKPVCDFATVAR